jgi:hypothetical protein
MDDKEILLEEWKDIRETLRYFGNKRFARLTVFLAAEGAAISAFLNAGSANRGHVFQVVGLLLAALFFIMELSSVNYWRQFAARAAEIEVKIGHLKLMTEDRQQKRGLWSATNATYLVYLLTALFWIFSFGCWCARPLPAEPLRIVIAGDGRADYPSPSPYPFKSPRAEDEDGINKVITREMVQAVLNEKAKTLLWTGDLTNVSEGDVATFERQLLAWREIVKPLYDNDVMVLPVRGNHEVVWYDPNDTKHKARSIPDAKKTWDKVFSGRYALPPNGPPDEKNVSFYYATGSALCVGLDQYQDGDDPSRHAINQAWFDQVLNDHKKPFVFAYGHEPAFAASTNHKSEDTLAADLSKRNDFWESLINAGARAYFCGHDHFYDHMSIGRDGADPGPEMHQLIAGTAGAPFYDSANYSSSPGWKLSSVHHVKTYGYTVIEIDGNKATITFKGRTAPDRYEVMDSFSYSVSAQ